MIRSVTDAIVGFSAMLLVPADAVALSQRDSGGWPPRARRIRPRRNALLRPGIANAVDPDPLRFDFVAADEQCRIALNQIEKKALIGNAPTALAERIGEAQIKRDFAQAHAVPVEP